MDLLVKLRDFWIEFIFWLNPNIASFIIRMGLMLLITYILLNLAWLRMVRTVFTQTLFAVTGVIISLYIPTDVFRTGKDGNFASLVTFFFLVLIFMPNWLPPLLMPRYGDQLKLKRIIKRIVWILFVLQIIFCKL